MNDDESMLPPTGPEAEEVPLRLLEDMLHNRILQKKEEIQDPGHCRLGKIMERYNRHCNGYSLRVLASEGSRP